MKKLLSALIGLLVVLYLAALLVPIDPQERRPGTRLSGELAVQQNPDWSFLEDRTQIYVETRTWYRIPHSVTTVSWASNGHLYVPCGRCATKRWPRNVARDPRVRLKINGQLYQRRAVPIPEAAEIRRLLGVAADQPMPDVAVYRMDPEPVTAQ